MTVGQPLALVYDPLTWDHDWSYDIEGALLASHGVKLAVPRDEVERDQLVRDADVVISSSLVAIDSEIISSLSNCVGILCYSSGMDAVDIAAATDAGIQVSNVQANTIDVAEHAMALLLALRRMIVPMGDAAAKGRWDLRGYPEIWTIPRLVGQVMGIVGAGRVGREVATRARGFGMTTVACYHNPPSEPPADLPHVELSDLMSMSDVVMVCASLNSDSVGMIDRRALARVKAGAVLVNVARGGLVDETALVDALDSGQLGGVALDVRDPEPPERGDPLRGRPNVLQTPHMAGASAQARIDLHQLAAEGVVHLLRESDRLQPEKS